MAARTLGGVPHHLLRPSHPQRPGSSTSSTALRIPPIYEIEKMHEEIKELTVKVNQRLRDPALLAALIEAETAAFLKSTIIKEVKNGIDK